METQTVATTYKLHQAEGSALKPQWAVLLRPDGSLLFVMNLIPGLEKNPSDGNNPKNLLKCYMYHPLGKRFPARALYTPSFPLSRDIRQPSFSPYTVYKMGKTQLRTAGFHTLRLYWIGLAVSTAVKRNPGDSFFLWIEKAGTQKSVPAMEAFYFCSVSFSSSMSWRACSGPSTRWGVSSTNRVGRPTRLSLRTSSKAG